MTAGKFSQYGDVRRFLLGVQVVSVAASDEDHIIASISLSEESIDQITRLFKIIDRNHDGTLDTKDFSLVHDKTGEQFKKWTEVRSETL